ncbi:MAG TPA: GatB/YqeY domain-containing protein [Mycobacteriales bacterium]
MSALKEKLHEDMTQALRVRDERALSTLRMVLAAVQTEEVSGKAARELSDEQVLQVLTREAKKRREAAEAFEQAGRDELAAKERAEGEIIAAYLPAQLTDDELREVVAEALVTSGAHEMGPAMKAANAAVGGRAEGGRVAAEVRRQLG